MKKTMILIMILVGLFSIKILAQKSRLTFSTEYTYDSLLIVKSSNRYMLTDSNGIFTSLSDNEKRTLLKNKMLVCNPIASEFGFRSFSQYGYYNTYKCLIISDSKKLITKDIKSERLIKPVFLWLGLLSLFLSLIGMYLIKKPQYRTHTTAVTVLALIFAVMACLFVVYIGPMIPVLPMLIAFLISMTSYIFSFAYSFDKVSKYKTSVLISVFFICLGIIYSIIIPF